jgi:cell division protein FtsZ
MSNGGVAILGSASAEGENRAQQAIENALNSPLLNDNDIRGAKWILININSSEGEHEFTMDEVEVIQNYLLSNAGEDTDVILGLGYDNSLGSEIGITLIATGFEHKDPFEKKSDVVIEEKTTDKIIMTLEMPEKSVQPAGKLVKVIQQPTLQFDENEEEKAIEEITEKPVLVMLQDEMMPTLVEIKQGEIKVEPPRKTTGEKLADAPVFFEISSAADQTPVIAFDIPTTPVPIEKPVSKTVVQPIISATNKDASNAPSSGVKLAKPAQIYVQEQPTPESNSTEELLPLQITIKADEPEIEMQLVVKSHQAAEEEQLVQQTQPIMMSNVEDPAPQDETEELRRRAIERIAKLRNLSFNINAADPNNEFEMVPAYLRRNMELHNSIAEVENFYSSYTVKSDDNNQASISTINSFLEGKKPD